MFTYDCFIFWLHPHRVRSTGVKPPFADKTYDFYRESFIIFKRNFFAVHFYHFDLFSLRFDACNYPALSHGNLISKKCPAVQKT